MMSPSTSLYTTDVCCSHTQDREHSLTHKTESTGSRSWASKPIHCHWAQDYSERRSLRAELRQLQKEERKRQERAVTEVIRGAQVGFLECRESLAAAGASRQSTQPS